MIDVQKLAREAGFDVALFDINDPLVYEAEPKHVSMLIALVLEEAAKECDEEHKRARFNMDVDVAKNREFWNGAAIFADQLGEAIRSLKEGA